MTYKEIKARLSKCELTLEKLKNGKVTNLKPADLRKKTAQLEVLRESYIKQLKEAQEKTYLVTPKSGKTAALSLGDDEVDALKDADDIEKIKSSDGNEVKENEGIKFSIEETKSIAKSVGKAVAMSLKALGDSVSSMKAKNIEESSFEIYVQYKNGADDQFSFYITDDTLHLVDFSFDKELTDVGVKPSGEAIVNVDVLANELQKHFKSLNETEVSEAPDGMYYIKIPKDAASQNKAQVIFDDLYGIKYEINDDPKGIVMYFKKEDFDAGVIDDLEGDGVQILDTNVPMNEEDVKQIEAPEGGMDQGGDLDVGHQDDEPNMLKKDLYDVITYASKLYKALDKYDQHDGEVDFPHWWQKKVTLAREYMSAAQHYLEGEEKQPAIDQLALESLILKEWGGSDQHAMNQSMHKDLGNPDKFPGLSQVLAAAEAAVDFYWDDWEEYKTDREGLVTYAAQRYTSKMFPEFWSNMQKLFAPANEGKYKSDAQRKAIHAKKAEMNEASYDDAIAELRNIVDQAVDLGEEARELVRQYFRDELSRLEGYGAFDFAYSSNRYDVTLGRFVDRLEEEGYDGDSDDLDEGIAKTQKAYGLVVAKMKELAKQYKAGDKSVIAQLKDLTAKKKQLEKQLEKDVAGKNRGQQLDPNINEYRGVEDDIKAIIRDKAADSGFDEQEEAMEVMEFIGQEYDIDFEFGAGPSRMAEDHSGNPNDKYVVRPCKAKDEPWAVWEGETRVKGFKTKPEAQAFADKKNKEQGLSEEKATYCGRCKTTHKKSSGCPK